MICMNSNSKVKYIALAVSFFASCFAYGDLIPGPVQQDFPLHRIGIEYVLTMVSASLGGSMALKWVLKRGWKFEKDVSKNERQLLEAKIKAVRPMFSRCCIALRLLADLGLVSRWNHKDLVNLILRLNPELSKELEGVPVEWVDCEIDHLNFADVADEGTIRTTISTGDDYWASPEEYCEWSAKDRRRESYYRSLYSRRMFRRRLRRGILIMLISGITLYLAWWLGQRF